MCEDEKVRHFEGIVILLFARLTTTYKRRFRWISMHEKMQHCLHIEFTLNLFRLEFLIQIFDL
jgi:hypothetical protein